MFAPLAHRSYAEAHTSLCRYGDHSRYIKTYFSQYPGFYFTGDGCVRDKDGYIWITGRVDDVINKAGHRIGTAEVESALVGHSACAEAAVIGIDDKVKGQAIFAYVSVIKDIEIDENQVINNLKQEVRKRIGGLAVPDYIVITPYLPKVRHRALPRFALITRFIRRSVLFATPAFA